MSQVNVAIQGATGNVGSAVVKTLAAKYAKEVRVIAGVRDEKKSGAISAENVEVRKINTADSPAELQKALQGANRMLIIPPNDDKRFEVCTRLIDDAKSAGVEFVLLHSFIIAFDRDSIFGKQMAPVEDHLKASGMKYCIIRANLYLQNFMAMKEPLANGMYPVPVSAETRIPFTCVEDCGSMEAQILAHPEKHYGQTYILSNQEAPTQTEIAAMLSRATGKEVKYVQTSWDDAKKFFMKVGFPEWQADGVLQLYKSAEDNGPQGQTSDTFETVTGSKTTNIEQWLTQHLKS